MENTGSGLGFYSADSVLIETTDLTPTTSALTNDDLIIEARDAVIGLTRVEYSGRPLRSERSADSEPSPTSGRWFVK